MKIANRKCLLIGLLVMVIALTADQMSKSYILQLSHQPGSLPAYLTSFFGVALVWNRGISFGILAAQNQPLFLMLMSLAIVGALFAWLCRTSSGLVTFALGCVMGGAIGNVIDRLRYGAVVDFLDFHIGIYHWPAFNIADSSIFIGVVLLCLDGMVRPSNNPEGSS